MKHAKRRITGRRLPGRTLAAIVLAGALCLAGGIPLSAQWHQTSGPAGANVAGVFAGDGLLLAAIGADVYRREGELWQRIGSFPDVERHPAVRTGDMWAMQKGVLIAPYQGRILRSVDRGVTWEILDVEGQGPLEYNGSFYLLRDDPTFQHDAALLKSSDGTEWKEIGTVPNFSNQPEFFGGAIYVTASYGTDVLRSEDEGKTWETLTPRFEREGRESSAGTSGLFSIAAGESHLYGASGAEVFRSTDGEVWTNISGDLPEPMTISEIGSRGAYLYIRAQTGEVYRYDGEEWIKVPVEQAHRLTLTDDGGLVLSTYTGGLFRVDGATLQSAPIIEGLIRTNIYALGAIDNTLLASASGKLYRSEDGGENWEETSGFDGWTASRFHTAGGVLYALDGTPHRSLDKGKTWEMFGPQYDFELEGHNYHRNVSAIAATDDAVYLGISEYRTGKGGGGWADGGVYRSDDNGESWMKIDAGLPYDGGFATAPVSSLVADGNNLVITTAAGVYRSTNRGTYWAPAMNGITPEDREFGGGTVLESAGKLLLSMRSGLYESTDGGLTWNTVAMLLSAEETSNIALFDLDDELYVQTYRYDQAGNVEYRLLKYNGNEWKDVTEWQPEGISFTTMIRLGNHYDGGTMGHGVWKLDRNQSIGGTSSIVAAGSERENHELSVGPNPTSGSAVLCFRSESAGSATVEMFNGFGRAVLTIDGVRIVQGETMIPLDLSTLTSGSYFVKVTPTQGKELRTQLQLVR